MFTEDVDMDLEDLQPMDEELEEAFDIEIKMDIDELEKKNATHCICPKCGKHHTLKMFWTGRGTPRIYCHRCREQITTVSDCAIYETKPDVFRVARGIGAGSEN